MPFDYQLVGGGLLLIFGIVGMANAWVESRSMKGALVTVAVGVGLIGWAWQLSDGGLKIHDVPDAIFRLIAVWM